MRESDTVFRTGAGEADDVFRADVRSKDGRANNPPSKISASQEVIRGGVFALFDYDPGDAEQDSEIDGNRQPIESG